MNRDIMNRNLPHTNPIKAGTNCIVPAINL
jgi:hypothetical protein